MLEEKLNPKNYIKQILINLEAANDNLVKTALKKEKLIYKKRKSQTGEKLFNIFDHYSGEKKSFANIYLIFQRLIVKLVKILFSITLITTPILLIILYLYQFEILLFLIRNNVDTSLVSILIDMMNESIQFIRDIYNKIFNLVYSIDFFN